MLNSLQIMLPFQYQLFTTTLKKYVLDGTIPMSRINDAVTRILRVKFANGLFEKPYSDPTLRPYLGAPVSWICLPLNLCDWVYSKLCNI